MPALLLHMSLARQTLQREGVPLPIARACEEFPGAFLVGSVLVDLPYHARFGLQLLRHLRRQQYRPSEWGDILHTRRTGRFALALLCHIHRTHAAGAEGAEMMALTAGYLSHHAVDRQTHPAIQRMVAAQLDGTEHYSVVHARIENRQSIHYHHDLLGFAIPGSGFPARLVSEMAGHGLWRPALPQPLWQLIRAACLETHGRAPSTADMQDWLWGVTAYGRLLSSTVGRRERLQGDMQELRAKHFQGPGVDLHTPLERSVDLTLDYWRAALNLLESRRITEEVRHVFLRSVPDVDLGMGD